MGVPSGLLSQYRNVFLVLGAACTGVLIPGLGPYLEPLVTPLVAFLVYSFLREFRLGEVEFRSDAALVVLSGCLSYIVLPFGGIRIAGTVLPEGATLGFAIIFAAPTTAVSAVWTRFSRGDVRVATAITVASILIAPVATPVVLGRLIATWAAVPVVPIFTDLLLIVGGGVLLTVLIPSSAVSTRAIDAGAMAALLVLIYASTARVDLGGVSRRVLIAIVAVSALLLILGLAVAVWCERSLRLDRAQTIPLFFTSSMKNLGIALLISLSYSSPLAIVAIVTYFVVQQLFGALVTDYVS